MMRQIQVCLPLVLSLLAGTAMLAGQQTQPGKTQQSAPSASPAHPSASHHSVHKRHARRAVHKGKKRGQYRPEYSENSVEVINGDATKKVVFQNDQASSTAEKKTSSKMKNAPAPMKVEVVNGAATDTQYFYDNGQSSETARNQPVVIGIESSDTRTRGGNKQPVVTSVTSSGVQNGKSVGRVGEPVMKQVSPRPKRPAYQPEPH